MGVSIDNEKKGRILELRARGLSYAKISDEVKVAKQTAIDVCKAQTEQIATLEAIELETLYETHRITKRERIEAHASLLSRIRKELESRTLSDVPTDKLIDLAIKVSSALSGEIIEPNFQTTEEQERDRKERLLINDFSTL
jgi:intein-encoded DNA endonuclease-like protein